MESYIAGDLLERSPDEIEQQIKLDELLIARLRARQLANIQLADRMQLAAADGCRNLREWVASRADTSLTTATSLVLTARHLADRPDHHLSLAAGDKSFERVSTTATIDESIDADSYDIDHLRRLARQNAGMNREAETAIYDERYLHIQPTLDHSAWKLWGQLAALDGAIVEQALFARADEFPNDPTTSRATKTADALVSISQDILDLIHRATREPDDVPDLPSVNDHGRSYERTRPGITVFVNARSSGAIVGTLMGGPMIGPNTIEEILCTGTIEPIGVTANGTPINVGRKSAKIPPRLRRFVIGRDGGCATDGCNSRYRLQVHHRVHWSDGGETDATNLVTLCWYHHHVIVHQRGYKIAPDSPPQRLRFQPQRTNGP